MTALPNPHVIEKAIDILDLHRLFKQHETVDAEQGNVFDEDEDGKNYTLRTVNIIPKSRLVHQFETLLSFP
jgi:hypothetical protein